MTFTEDTKNKKKNLQDALEKEMHERHDNEQPEDDDVLYLEGLGIAGIVFGILGLFTAVISICMVQRSNLQLQACLKPNMVRCVHYHTDAACVTTVVSILLSDGSIFHPAKQMLKGR